MPYEDVSGSRKSETREIPNRNTNGMRSYASGQLKGGADLARNSGLIGTLETAVFTTPHDINYK